MPKRLMPPKVFTEKYIATLTTNGKPQFEHFDAMVPGLLLRIAAWTDPVTNKAEISSRTWGFKFKNPADGVWSRMTIGPYGKSTDTPIIGLAMARDKAREIAKKVDEGKDPRAKEAIAVVRTVRDVLSDRLTREVAKLKSARNIGRRFGLNMPQVILDMPIRDFRKPHLNMIIDPIIDRGAPIEARKMFEDVSALINYALSRGEIEFNPMVGAKKPEASLPRERFLSLEEIAKTWNGLPTAMASAKIPHVPSICRLMLATAQRVGEVAAIRRSQIDEGGRVWTIPNPKNGHKHTVPLNDLAWEIISDRLRKTNGDVLFPRKDGEAFDSSAIGTSLIYLHGAHESLPLGKLNMSAWTTHDLRRTVSTQASIKENNLPVADQWMDHVMNHIGVIKNTVRQRHYNVNTFLDEKRAALDEWGAFLARVVGRDDTMKIAAE